MRRWEQGRQGTGYRKFLIACGERWDCYLLDYPPGTHVPPHTDPVPGRRHFRCNLVLWGERAFEGRAVLRAGPLVIFRSDVTIHSVKKVTRRRLVLSIGAAF